jgi:STAM-binding protein
MLHEVRLCVTVPVSTLARRSSIDMHTQAAYQLMLPEAVAIVLAPKERASGTFSLSTYGLGVIRQVRRRR